MDNNNFFQRGLDIVKQAVVADNAGDYERALDLYSRSLDAFLSGLRFEKDPTKKRFYEEKAAEYMNRAETLKKAVETQSTHSGGGGSSGAATAQKPPGETGGDDGEAKKLQGALAGAIVSEKPNVKWEDVAGLEGAKDALKEAVILPYKFPQLFTGNRKPWKGILLYGPPGTGKSFLAKAVATEADATFFSVSSSDLVSKWQGESERLVRNLFEMAREKKPSIVFIDEIDSMCGSRGEGSESESARRIKTEFLVQMQGVGKSSDGVLVLAATNTPWEIDAAMRRRFEKRIYIPLPEAHARSRMFKLNIGDTPNSLTEDDYRELAAMTEGFSGSDISVAVREAIMEPLRKCRTAKFFRKDPRSGMYEPVMDDPPCPRCPVDLSDRPAPRSMPCQVCFAERKSLYDLGSNDLQVPLVTIGDFRHALQNAKSSVAERELEKYVAFTKEFGAEGN